MYETCKSRSSFCMGVIMSNIWRLKGLPGLRQSDWHDTLKYFKNKCAYCGKSHIQSPLEKDHILAVSKGGTNAISNVVPCCHDCNISKRDHDMVQWFLKQPFYNKNRLAKISVFIILQQIKIKRQKEQEKQQKAVA